MVKDDSIPHGTYAGYKKGCRCEACHDGRRKYERERRQLPEVKQRRSEYNKSPERKERARERARKDWKQPAVKEQARESRRKRERLPEYKARKREYERKRKERLKSKGPAHDPAKNQPSRTSTRYTTDELSYLPAEQASTDPYLMVIPTSKPTRKTGQSAPTETVRPESA